MAAAKVLRMDDPGVNIVTDAGIERRVAIANSEFP
jgi:hypothetical protein